MKMKRKARTYRRKSYGKRKKISPKLRKAVKSIVKANIETKEFVVVDSNVNIREDDILYYNPLFPIAQGVGDFQRIGNRIRLQRIEMKGVLSNGSNASVNSTQPGHVTVWFMRVPVIQNGNTLLGNWNTFSAAQEEIIFDNPSGTFQVPSMLKPNTKRGIKVMMKKTYRFTPSMNNSSTTGAPTSVPFVWNINMKNTPFLFEEFNTGFQTKYNYYFVASGFIQNAGAVNSVVHNIRWECRTYFKDA